MVRWEMAIRNSNLEKIRPDKDIFWRKNEAFFLIGFMLVWCVLLYVDVVVMREKPKQV